MTPESRKQLRELALAATPGPWILEGTGNVPDISYYGPKWENPPTKDEEYIAAANPQTILSLLDDNDRLRKALEFYADSDNWGHGPDKGIYYREMVDDSDLGDGSFMLSETVDDNRVAGKRAREALGGGK